MVVERAGKGFFMLSRWVGVEVALCLSFQKDGDGPSKVGSWVGAKGCFKFLRHVVNGLSGGGGFERLGSARVASQTY